MAFVQNALIPVPQLVSPLAYQTSGKGAETEPESLIYILKRDLEAVNQRGGTQMELFEYRVHLMRWFAVSAEANLNADPMGHEQDTNDAGTLCGKRWEGIQKIGENAANKHDEKWATALRTFKAQTAKNESCCCLKVVRKQEKSAKPTGVKKETGLGQPAAKKLKTRVKVEDPESGDGVEKQAGTLLSIAEKRKVETAVVHEEPGLVRMTVKERAAVKLAAHTLTFGVCGRT